MDTDTDERLIKKGQYPYAENLDVINTDGSDIGAIENMKGNEKLTDLNLTNATALGAYSDSARQLLYWFVTSDEKDLVLEYDVPNSNLSILLESSNPDGVLNFNKDFLITGVVKIINGDFKRDLLGWVDDRNNPRLINIERSKTYGLDGFEEDDIILIKKPPRYAPTVDFTFTPSTQENYLQNKFLSIAYRYKYLDGDYSAISSLSNYAFAPSGFNLDYQTMENEGMQNQFNALNIGFNTGSKRVTDIELLFKEAESSTVYLIETFNKENEGWANDTEESFLFSNSKSLSPLPEKELFRQFDNVPRKAKAMEAIGNRIAFANYIEQYDLKNKFGQEIDVDYSLSLINNDLSGDNLAVSLSAGTIADSKITFNIGSYPLTDGARLSFNFELKSDSVSGTYSNTLDFILNKDYANMNELAVDEDFILFITSILSGNFESDYDATPPDDSEVQGITGFTIDSSTTTTITIAAPTIEYLIDDTPADLDDNPANTHVENADWYFRSFSEVFYREIAIDTSLKTNRSYEVGIIYLDEYNRSTTTLTDADNTIYVRQEYSIFQNKIVVNLNHLPPAWADRYKFVVKTNRGLYHTIYTNVFYEDGLYRWVKLEGANKDKVREGDTLIVKSDLGGIVEDVIKVRVLEVKEQDKDFIEGNTNIDGDDIIEEAGLYMKIKPAGFDMNFNDATARTFEGASHLRYPVPTHTNPDFGTTSSGTFNPYKINAGSTIRIFINFKARGSISYDETYDRTFRSGGDYDSMQEWFDAEVVDLGSFGEDYTRSSGLGDDNRGVGWDFTSDGSQFWVRAHRDGTASRKITTTVKFEVLFSEGTVIFETVPTDIINDVFSETEQTFDIVDGFHQANVQNQSDSSGTAIAELDTFNCYVQGNGAESFRYKDAFSVGTDNDGQLVEANYLTMDLRPTTTAIERYREVRRFADITYSATYNENSNVNGLNEFNLSTANYKEDIDKKYGAIQYLLNRNDNLLVFQEDKVSKVLYGKDLLYNADGTSNLSSIEEVLGQLVPYSGEYGVGRDPESIAVYGNHIFFVDAKRGCVCRLGIDGITEISNYGMRTYFKNLFKDTINTKKVAAYDPFKDQYVVYPSTKIQAQETTILCSGSYSGTGLNGSTVVNVDFGVSIGLMSFSYESNGVPVRFIIEWNGTSVSSNFVGDPSYNDELVALGYSEVTGGSIGEFFVYKYESIPTTAKVTIETPICGSSVSLNPSCIETSDLSVVSVILNDTADDGLTITSRYSWSNDTYSSPLKSVTSTFDGGNVLDTYSVGTSAEGVNFIPINGSRVKMEAFTSMLHSGSFEEGNRLGYLISENFYSPLQVDDMLALATFPEVDTVEGAFGFISNSIEFDFDRTTEIYLYLIWDYRN